MFKFKFYKGLIVLTHEVNSILVNKDNKSGWTKEKKEKVQHNLIEKKIITTALGLEEFLCVSHH